MTIPVFAMTVAALTQADAAAPDLAALLERVSAYVDSYERELGAVVCRERYSQKLTRNGRVRKRRELTSDFFLLSFPDHASLGFRDIEAIDGRPLRNRAKRLRRFFEAGGAVKPMVVLRESARHNIGKMYRTVNSPTFPLAYLRRANRANVRFAIEGSGLSAGRLVVQLRYLDSQPDTQVHNTAGQPVPATGVATVDVETGRVLSIRVILKEPAAHLGAELEVRFTPDERLALWVPAEMRERYWFERQSPDEVVECLATYADFSRVVVDTREWYRVPQEGAGEPSLSKGGHREDR